MGGICNFQVDGTSRFAVWRRHINKQNRNLHQRIKHGWIWAGTKNWHAEGSTRTIDTMHSYWEELQCGNLNNHPINININTTTNRRSNSAVQWLIQYFCLVSNPQKETQTRKLLSQHSNSYLKVSRSGKVTCNEILSSVNELEYFFPPELLINSKSTPFDRIKDSNMHRMQAMQEKMVKQAQILLCTWSTMNMIWTLLHFDLFEGIESSAVDMIANESMQGATAATTTRFRIAVRWKMLTRILDQVSKEVVLPSIKLRKK